MDIEDQKLACLKMAGCHTNKADEMVWFAEKLMRYVTNWKSELDPKPKSD